jgi:anaerobic selenocysteine-containing dehydrogenase
MCDLCPTGCGLEVLVDNNRIVKARGDQALEEIAARIQMIAQESG